MIHLMEPGFGTIIAEDERAHETWVETLTRHDHLIETWNCDLATGIFSVGEKTRVLHGLEDRLCGLLDIIRGYHEDHHRTVLNILEQATSSASSFCYCTTVPLGNGRRMPVHCVGTSNIRDNALSGRMQGIFAFARM